MNDFKGPKSVCTCGHTGDGEGSDHLDFIVVERGGGIKVKFDLPDKGHGCCSKCTCRQFIWKKWTDEFREEMLEGVKHE